MEAAPEISSLSPRPTHFVGADTSTTGSEWLAGSKTSTSHFRCKTLERLEVLLTPPHAACRKPELFSIEEEYAALSSPIISRPLPPLVSPKQHPAASGLASYLMTPQRNIESSKVYGIEKDYDIFSAAQALRELGSGKAEAQLVWEICLMREKLQRAGHLGFVHQAFKANWSEIEAARRMDPHSIADEQVWPDIWRQLGADKVNILKPLGSDPLFNFLLLEKVELRQAQERLELISTCLWGWKGCTQECVSFDGGNQLSSNEHVPVLRL